MVPAPRLMIFTCLGSTSPLSQQALCGSTVLCRVITSASRLLCSNAKGAPTFLILCRT
ncbi:hypothetical protein PR001_g14798 [Phytophthora rubi]|uniref:Uncharacterized protein n=2 Tax=Phytophthora TaxID=4783 RepID=A0A6A3KW12_9STRA|nr:hypothetical protein PR002_g15205 [Phytophthora rubi]KAE9015845.1 hypothetical protein PR001_g14798 [Phytophthora rubi]KAE9303372.1 hypothetical protein PF008_g22245 [Phytophthora fragariae]